MAGIHALEFGGAQTMGGRPLPLIQVRLTEWLSLDGDARLSWSFSRNSVADSYRLGVSGTF